MNIIEAIKSGKRFARRNEECFFPYNADRISANERKNFSIDDVLADDWEVEEKKITITKSEFMSVFKYRNQFYHATGPIVIDDTFKECLWEVLLLTQSQK